MKNLRFPRRKRRLTTENSPGTPDRKYGQRLQKIDKGLTQGLLPGTKVRRKDNEGSWGLCTVLSMMEAKDSGAAYVDAAINDGCVWIRTENNFIFSIRPQWLVVQDITCPECEDNAIADGDYLCEPCRADV